MGEYAPDAIHWLADQIETAVPGATLSGIVGDQNHHYGYHRSRAALPPGDYSVILDQDQRGDPHAASAIDISLPPAGMRWATANLLAVSRDRHDPRRRYYREFFGTLDGDTVTGWDNAAHEAASSDTSHLWHIHISIHRQYVNDRTAMAAILSAFLGHDKKDDDMPRMVSVDTKDPQQLALNDWTTLSFDTEYSDPDHDHADKGGPTILRTHAYFTATVSGHIPGLPAGTTVKARTVEVRKTTDDDGNTTYPIRKTYDSHELISTPGDTNIQFTQAGSLDAGNRLRVQVRVYLDAHPDPVALVGGRVKCLYWKR